MKLPIFDKKEDVPAVFADLYEEKDGKWVPKADDDDTTAPLKTALDKERKRADDAEKALKAEKKRLELESADLERKKKGITDDQLKQIREDVKKEVEAEFAPVKKDLDDAKKDNRTLRLDNKVRGLFGKVGVRGERHDALWKLINEDFDLTDDGAPMVKAAPGTEVEKYLADSVKKMYPEFFEGTKAAGSGAAGTGGTTTPPAKPGQMTADDVIKNPAAALQQARAT